MKTGIETAFEGNKQELHVLDQTREKSAKLWSLNSQRDFSETELREGHRSMKIEFVKAFQFSYFLFFGKLKNESEKFCFQLFGKLHFTRNLDLLENRKINSLNFHFHYFKNKSKNLHFYEKKNWILKKGLLQSFSIFSKNEIMKMN